MVKLRWIIQPSLIFILSFGLSTGEIILNDNSPIRVQWTTTMLNQRGVPLISFKDLHGTNVDGMFNHYKNLNSNEVRESAQNDYLSLGTPALINSVEYEKKEVLKKFTHHTINAVSNNYNYSDCGIEAESGTLKLKYCPGQMTIITLNHIGVYTCNSIKSLTVFGPVIVKAESCSEQILSEGSCELAITHGILRDGCHVVSKDSRNDKFLVGFIMLLILNIIFLTGLIIFYIRYSKIKKLYNSKITFKGVELHNFSIFDSESGVTVSKDTFDSEGLINMNKKKFSWCRIIMMILFCRPIVVNTYELVDSQKINNSLYKYTIDLASSEVIQIGSKTIHFVNSDSTSRLVHMFSSYDWEVEFENKYYCLQSGCNDKFVCREDLLPFMRQDNLIGDEFPNFKNRVNYYVCKNMRNYCAFASGCFIMALSLKLDDSKRYEVYKVSQQNRISREVELPPGCYLDEYTPDRSSGVDEMYYVEDKFGTGWFCHPSIYSHYPLPHSLGDIKVGKNNSVNFITDFLSCSTDKWRDVYCTKPTSFLSHLDNYCVRNDPNQLGFQISRQENSLSWPSDKLETVKISCDRDLQLIQSDHHCDNIQIEIWDTGNVQSDLLMSIYAESNSGYGVFILPASVHAESHHFGCNEVWHNTFLYDLQSLNSSGLSYKFHTNVKPMISDEESGKEVKPINEDHWYNLGIGKWFSSVRGWLTGMSSISLIIIGNIAIMILRR